MPIAQLQRAIELEPRNDGAYSRLGNTYEQMGKYAEALASYAKQGALMGHSGGESRNKARLYAAMGKADEARRLVGPHMDRWPEVHVALGDKDTAFSVLFKSVDKQQSEDWPLYVMSDPQYESLHGDPRWNELLARMNFVTN